MKLIALLVLFTSFPVFGQSKKELKEAYQRRDKYLFAVTATPKKFSGSVIAEYLHDEMLVPVTINGKTYTFLFDTGAITIVSPQLAQELDLKAVTSNAFSDAAGVETVQDFSMLHSLTFQGVTFSNIAVATISLDTFSLLFCRKIDGIFGTNIMRLADWKIDYDTHQISFSTEKRMVPDQDFDTEAFEPSFSGSPIIQMVAGRVQFGATVDTGNNRTLDIPEELYQQSTLSKNALSRQSTGRTSFSLSGNKDQQEWAVLADTLYFGNRLLTHQRLRVSPSSPILIGNTFLKQFGQIGISWKKSKLYLPKKTQPLEINYSFGFTPLLEDGKIIVAEVWENTPAQEKGIALGDVVLRVNDLDLSAPTPEIWCNFAHMRHQSSSWSVDILKPDGSKLTLLLERLDLLKS